MKRPTTLAYTVVNRIAMLFVVFVGCFAASCSIDVPPININVNVELPDSSVCKGLKLNPDLCRQRSSVDAGDDVDAPVNDAGLSG